MMLLLKSEEFKEQLNELEKEQALQLSIEHAKRGHFEEAELFARAAKIDIERVKQIAELEK